MAAEVKMLTGRKWKRTRDKKNGVTVKYRCILDAAISAGSEGVDITGVPKPGDEHPNDDKLEVASVDYEEESTAGAQKIVVATVNYEPKDSASQTTTQEEGGVIYQVDEWGWDDGTEERELLEARDSTAQSPKPVLNSAGDPFDSVPKISMPAPIFTKVMKFAARRSGAMGYSCKVNSEQMTIGDRTCAAGTLLCSVSEKRIFGDPDFNYSYTVRLKYKSNFVKLHGSGETTECGWDAALVDAGMREKDTSDSTGRRKVLIRVVDNETGQECVVSSPALLDGNGYKISSTDNDQTPRNLRFKAYERTQFPNWFYSEPPLTAPEDDDDDDEQTT